MKEYTSSLSVLLHNKNYVVYLLCFYNSITVKGKKQVCFKKNNKKMYEKYMLINIHNFE